MAESIEWDIDNNIPVYTKDYIRMLDELEVDLDEETAAVYAIMDSDGYGWAMGDGPSIDEVVRHMIMMGYRKVLPNESRAQAASEEGAGEAR